MVGNQRQDMRAKALIQLVLEPIQRQNAGIGKQTGLFIAVNDPQGKGLKRGNRIRGE